MATNNPQAPTRPSALRDVDHLRANLTIVIDDLYNKGRGDLTVPFARMLIELASVDFAALDALDAETADTE